MPTLLHCTLLLFVSLLCLPAHAHTNVKSSWPAVQHIRGLLAASSSSQYSITSSVSSFTENGQITQVTVKDASNSNNSKPSRTDTNNNKASNRANHLLALYPSPSDPSKTVPITFLNISTMRPSYITTGQATVPFKLLNFRSTGFILRLVSSSPLQPLVLAESNVIPNTIQRTPGQVHLALHRDGRSMVVQWVSSTNEPQQLEYSTTPWSPDSSSSSGRGSSSSNSASHKQQQQGGIKSVSSSSRTYSAAMMCGVPANSFGFMDPGHLHTAVLPAGDVAPGQQLHYRVGSYSVGWSPVLTFTAAPSPAAVAANQEAFTFLVFNDVGQENAVLFDNVCPPYCPAGWAFEPYTTNSTKLLKHLLAETDARLGLLVGDLSYANGYLVDWDWFGYQFEPAFTRWPVMMAVGNHEQDAHGSAAIAGNNPASGGECGIPYTYRYYTPAWPEDLLKASTSQQTPTGSSTKAVAPPRTTQQDQPRGIQQESSGQNHQLQQQQPAALSPSDTLYYSFEMGGVHFLMLDTESPSEPDSPQGKFVAADLAQVDRQRTPWLVVGLHRQMVGPTNDPVNVKTLSRLQGDLEDVFLKHKVDLVLQGHDHAYARTCPYAKGSCATPAPTRAGADSHSRSSTSKTANKSKSSQGGVVEKVYNPTAPIYILAGHAGAGFTHQFPNPLPEWVVFGAQDRNGFVRVTVQGGTFRAVSVSTDDGSIMDGVEIVRVKAN